MTKKKVTTKDKPQVNHEAVARTLAAVLQAQPEGEAAQAIVRATDKLGAAISQPEIYDLRPVLMLRRLLDAHMSCAYDLDGQDKGKGRRAYARLVTLAASHGGAGYEVARRCAEIYEAAAGGAYYFAEHVDAVLEGGDDGLIPNPDSKYFVPLFLEAWRDRGPQDRRVCKLLDLIRCVDEGADLSLLAEEADRASEARMEAQRPKDARLVDALSKVIADPQREDDRITILDAINNLSNHTSGVSDFHPEIFPTLARVILREARWSKAAKSRGFIARSVRESIRRLEEIAGE